MKKQCGRQTAQADEFIQGFLISTTPTLNRAEPMFRRAEAAFMHSPALLRKDKTFILMIRLRGGK